LNSFRGFADGTGTSSADRASYFLDPSTLLSTIFRASSNASAEAENRIVAAGLSQSSSYTITMKPACRE
jgi:hypothetical protein